MRILRVRRGFTTNSSGDSEYLPIIPPPPAPADGPRDASVTGATDAGTTRADASARTAGPDAGRHSSKDASADAGVPIVAVNRPTDATGAPASAAPQGGSLTLVWVILGVIALFVAERVLRIVRKRAKERDPEKLDPEKPDPEKPGDDGQA